jgi:hypothetical protein
MQPNDSISLNFLPLAENSFSFTVFRLEDSGQRKIELPEGVSKQSLPVTPDNVDNRRAYWVSLSEHNGFEPFECDARHNQYVTRDFLHNKLIASVRAAGLESYIFKELGIGGKRVSFTLQEYPEGVETVWMEAYYLKSVDKFGFLTDFHFKRANNATFSKRVQQLSLSLDKRGGENKNFYSDRYDRLETFVHKYFDHIFPLDTECGSIAVSRKLLLLPSKRLDKKTYIFCEEQPHDSQFMGIKQYHPLVPLERAPSIFFVYRQQDRLLSLDLYKALRGERFPRIFPGTESMFGFSLTSNNVQGISISDFKEREMRRARDTILAAGSTRVLAILIAPWDDEEVEDSQDYFRTKHIFVSSGIPSQVVRLHTLESDSRLQWSTSNIALQCFAKLGGKPWKVRPRHTKCLIIGIGQSHREVQLAGKRSIEKYCAYSVLTDSSGLFEELRVLGRAESSEAYLRQLRKSIEDIVLGHSDRFERFVIHAPYKIRADELESIQKVLEIMGTKGQKARKQFVVLKINAKNQFFGYSNTNNSLVPFESSYVSLARNEFLVWFEGLQYHNPKVVRRYSRPIHIAFHYSNTKLSMEDRLNYLQDTINLSGANWRGFNAKNLPVSIYYAQLISRFTNKFDELGLQEIQLNNLNPWFL